MWVLANHMEKIKWMYILPSMPLCPQRCSCVYVMYRPFFFYKGHVLMSNCQGALHKCAFSVSKSQVGRIVLFWQRPSGFSGQRRVNGNLSDHLNFFFKSRFHLQELASMSFKV